MVKLKKYLLLLCYGVCLLVWLGSACFALVYDRAHPAQVLALEEAVLENLNLEPGGTLTAITADPQIIFEGLNAPVRTLRLVVEFEKSPGEMALYYQKNKGDGFRAGRRVFGALQEDGSYLYTLPAGRYYALRIDPGDVSAPNKILVYSIVVNPQQSTISYFYQSLYNLFAMAFLPALACAVICTIIEATEKVWKRKNAKGKGAAQHE